MKKCPQTDTQSVYQHGISVRDHLFKLIKILQGGPIEDNWKLPNWLFTYRQEILNSLLPEDILEEYSIYHDCSKPYCIQYDENGKKHFPNHAELSYKKWIEVGGNKIAAKLMKMDMMIHTIKSNEIDEFIKHPEAISLLLTGLAEILSNGKMFGGYDSTSYKIKYKQIDKRGRQLLTKLYGEKNVID